VTFVLVLFSWVLFRAANIADAGRLLATLCGHCTTRDSSVLLAAELYTQGNVLILAACMVLALQPVQTFDWVQKLTWPRAVVLIVLFCVSLAMMFVQAFNPFLYFQF